MCKVIMFGGKSRSGKDTAVNFLNRYGYSRVAFADKIKDISIDLYGLSKDQVYTNLKDVVDDRYSISPRHILQETGESQRGIYEDIWARYTFEGTIKDKYLKGIRQFCISDWRYKSEAIYAKNWAEKTGNEVVLVKIERPGIEALTNPSHKSEIDLDDYLDYDYKIINNSTLEDFLEQVKEIVNVV